MSDANPTNPNTPAAAPSAAPAQPLRTLDRLRPPAWVLELSLEDPYRGQLLQPYVDAHRREIENMAKFNEDAALNRQVRAFVETYGGSVLGHLTAKVRGKVDDDQTFALRVAACLWMYAHGLDFGLTARQLYPRGESLVVSAILIEAIARRKGAMKDRQWTVEYGEPIEWALVGTEWVDGNRQTTRRLVKAQNVAVTLDAVDSDGVRQALTMTLADAVRSGWATTNEKYASEPIAMLRARVRAAWVRAYAAEALLGLDLMEGEEESLVTRGEGPGAPLDAAEVRAPAPTPAHSPEGLPEPVQAPPRGPRPIARMAGMGPPVEAPPVQPEDLGELFEEPEPEPEAEPEPEPEPAPPPPAAPEPPKAPPPAARKPALFRR